MTLSLSLPAGVHGGNLNSMVGRLNRMPKAGSPNMAHFLWCLDQWSTLGGHLQQQPEWVTWGSLI